MFIPGCGCCGNKCQPCPVCAPQCVTLTFKGFSASANTCNECDFVDKGTYVLSRAAAPTAAMTIAFSDKSGAGAAAAATLAGPDQAGRYTVNSVSLTTGGSGYIAPVVEFLPSGLYECRAASAEVTMTTQTLKVNDVRFDVWDTSHSSTWAQAVPQFASKADDTIGTVSTVSGFAAFYVTRAAYSDGQSVSLAIRGGYGADVVVLEAATATISVPRVQPIVEVSVAGSGTGFSPTQSVSLESSTDENGNEYWSISEMPSPPSGTSGYSASNPVLFAFPEKSLYLGFPLASAGVVIEAPQASVQVDGDGAITGFTLTNPGKFFAWGAATGLTVVNGGKYYRNGIISTLTLLDGGEYYSATPCVYEASVCPWCPDHSAWTLRFTAGAETNSMSVRYADGNDIFLAATQSSVDEDGNPISCDGFVFKADSFKNFRCPTNGTVTVAAFTPEPGDDKPCSSHSATGCDSKMPDSITLTISGARFVMPNSGAPFFDKGECGSPTGLCAFLPPVYGELVHNPLKYAAEFWDLDHSVVCELVNRGTENCRERSYRYEGFLPSFATAGVIYGGDDVGYQDKYTCSDGSPGNGVAVQISRISLATTVSVAPPTNEGARAMLELGGVDGNGGVTSVSILDPGSGYAIELLHRVQPTVTASVISEAGTGASLSVKLEQKGTGDEIYWLVSGVTLSAAGTGYTEYDYVAFSTAPGVTVEAEAYAVLKVARQEPTVTASIGLPGSGAAFTVTLAEQTIGGSKSWKVSDLAITNGGTGYEDYQYVEFGTTGITLYSASAQVTVDRSEPTLEAYVPDGEGAEFSLTLEASSSTPQTWKLTGIDVTKGGTGYADNSAVEIKLGNRDFMEAFTYAKIRTGSGGTIDSVVLQQGGRYYHSDGVIQSVTLSYGGQYYQTDGSIESIQLMNGGVYYTLEPSGKSKVDDPAILFISPTGEGAKAHAKIDGTVGSETFGQITAVIIDEPGSKYRIGGDGWRASIEVTPLVHLTKDSCVVRPAFGLNGQTSGVGECNDKNVFVTSGTFDDIYTKIIDPTGTCVSIIDSLLEPSTRVTEDECPNNLLSRSYQMALKLRKAPSIQCGFAVCGEGSNYVRVMTTIGQGNITCTLSPN